METVLWHDPEDGAAEFVERTVGRGRDSVIEAVGTKPHGSPVTELTQKATTLLPDRVGAGLAERFGRIEWLLC